MASKFSILKRIGGKWANSSSYVLDVWRHLSSIPGGRYLFSRILGRYAPYTGSMPFLVEALEPGYAVIALEDRPRIRNHLKSIHAIALANVSELTGSLALTSSMPADARFIVKTLSIDYVKKARGRVVATCRCPVPKSNERAFYPVEVEVRNEKQEIVCRTELAILIGPKDSSL